MFKLIKSFLKWISPIEILFAQTPEEEVEQIDMDFKPKLAELEAKVLQENAQAELLSTVVMLCHQTAIASMSAYIASQYSDLVTRIETNPEDKEAREKINAILRDMDVSKSLDQLGVNILVQVYKMYPILHTYAKNNRLFPKGYDHIKHYRLEKKNG